MATTNMEPSPASFTPERYWTEEKERALIAFFSKHSCLWNHKSESYKNRQLRWRTLEHLRILLSADPPPVWFTVEDIKSKFKNLRTTFQRQYKLVKASRMCKSGDVFVPQWKHYQQLMFLQGCWDQDDSLDDAPLSPLITLQEENQTVPSTQEPVFSFLPIPATTSSSSSSAVPSNMIIKSFWTEERERELIIFYSEHSCLWNKGSENHNNRQLRLKLLEVLRSQLSQHPVSFSVEDLKCKFKNLRTVFNREYKAVEASRASDKPYVSKWKHYQQMLFLCESCDEDEGHDDVTLLRQEEKDPEPGNQTTNCSLSCFSSCSNQTNSAPDASSDVKPNAAAGHHHFLSASPDHFNATSQTTAFPTAALPDAKPMVKLSTVNFPTTVSVEADGKLSVDSACCWSEAKVQQLISFYSEHSCLWNHKSELYKNKLLRQSLLETLSSLLSDNETVPFSVEDVKTKFKNLRTVFQREHKSVNLNKTCGSEDFYLPKWKHYSDLLFLCDSCDEDEQPKDFQEPRESAVIHLHCQSPPSSLLCHGSTQTTTKLNRTSPSLKAPPSPTPPDSQPSSPPPSSPSTSSSCDDNRLLRLKRASPHLAPTSSEVLDFMRTFCQSQTASPHAGFLKYVEECLNEAPPDKVKKLKKKIIETIHSMSEEV